jgi:hypothetical protein
MRKKENEARQVGPGMKTADLCRKHGTSTTGKPSNAHMDLAPKKRHTKIKNRYSLAPSIWPPLHPARGMDPLQIAAYRLQ